MKVLQLNTYFNQGSTGNIVRTLFDEQMVSNIDAYVVYGLGRENKKHDPNIKFLSGKSLLPRFFKMCRYVLLGEGGNDYIENTNEIIEFIKHVSPDIIHIHNLHGDFGGGFINYRLLFDFLGKARIPVIWTLHDCWSFTGGCMYFYNCRKWLTDCTKCPYHYSKAAGILCDRASKELKSKKALYENLPELYVVTVSHWLESEAKRSILKDKKIKAVYNGIDCDVFYDRLSKDKISKKYNVEGKFIVLCIGWGRRKGFDDYFKLASLCDENIVIIVVGDRPWYRKSKSIPRNMVLISHVANKDEMAEIYSASDVYFNASEAETFGLTTAEAMACGTPSIAYDVTACPEVVGENELCGYAVAYRNIDAVCEKINLIRKKLRNSYSGECRKRAIVLFDSKRFISEYIDLYREVYEKHKSEKHKSR